MPSFTRRSGSSPREQPIPERGDEGPDGLEAGGGLRVALDLVVEREQAVDLLVEGLEGVAAPAELTLLRGQDTISLA